MDALAYSYGVTRGRGMTQCISASLLALDRWSLPNVTVRSSIFGRKLANFMSPALLAGVTYWKIVGGKNQTMAYKEKKKSPVKPQRHATKVPNDLEVVRSQKTQQVL